MSAAAQAVRPKHAPPAPEVRRRHKPEQRAVLTASPRYLRASVRLGGLHDPEEHEAERAASTISAGGCHQVVDPGGSANLRAAEVARAAASHDQVRPAAQSMVVDPGASGRVRRAPTHEATDPGGAHSLRATTAAAAPDKVADAPVRRFVETRAMAASQAVVDPGASGRVRRTPAPGVVDPGGTASLRATAAPPQVTDPGASGRIRRAADSAASDGAGHVRATPASDTRPLGHIVAAKRDEPHRAADADAEAAHRIERARMSVGQSLPATVRARLEHGFGVPLANVRVDTSPTARAAAAAIGARAYTEGERITLGHGESEHDLRLMAHETTHVVQNRRSGTVGRPMAAASGEIRRKVQADADSDSGDNRTYRMLDGRTIELPDDMTAAEAHELEMAGVAAKRRLGQGPPPKPIPDVHKPAEKTAKKAVKPPPKVAKGPHAKHSAGPHSAGVKAHLKPAASKVGQYLVSKAAPVLARGGGKIGNLSLHQQTHDNAGLKVQKAEKAVVIPESEGQSKSNFGQVGVIAARPPPAPDENKAKSELQDSLAQNVPKTIEDVDNFKRDMKAQHSGADVLKVVQTDKNAVVGTFGDMQHTPPPLPPEHVPEELPPPEVAPPTGAMNLGQGAVAPLLPEHTDVSQYTKDADDRLKQEGVTQEQLDMVDSGDLADANKEKKGLEKAAKTEPQAVRNFANDATAKVDRDLHKEEQAQRGALANHRKLGLHTTGEHQKTAKSTLEKKRDEVAAKINGIYQTTQDSVKKKLADLETQSMKRFDDGNARASKAFEDNVNHEIDAYKDDRYSGVFGWARKAKDWLLGMDELPRVKEIFDTNRETFVQTVNKLVEDISADNKRVVQECKDELAKAKTDIKDYVDKLGPELKDIANKTAGEVTGKLDELDGFIRKKEEELQQKLADKQQAAIKAIDDKIAKMKEAMSGALAKLGNLLLWAAKKFFTWALEQFGYSLNEIQGIIDKGVAVLKAIFTKPIQFVKNLIAAAKLGFMNFGKNFLTHLKDAIFDWLTGSMEGVTLPTSWDFKGIASVALQILGLTWANIRGKMVKLIGETPVKALETGFDLVVTLVRDGPMAAWEKIKEMGEEIKQAFIEGVKDFIKIKIIQKAIETVISLFVPGAGIVRAIIGIYDTVVFFIQKAKQIMEMIGNFLSSIGDIAAGNIGAAANALEKGLARGLTLVINFLARFLHLDGITAKIRAAIQKLRAKVDGMLDKVANWIADKAKKLGKFVAQAGVPQDPNERLRLGMAAGTAVANRFARRPIGRRVLEPLLGAVKVRYGFKSLTLVPDGPRWALEGEINPRSRATTAALVEQPGAASGGEAAAKPGAADNWWQQRHEFDAGKEHHTVYLTGTEGHAQLMVASRPVTWDAFVGGLTSYPSPTGVAAKTAADTAAGTLSRTMRQPATAFAPPATKAAQVAQDLNALAIALGRLLQLSPAGTNLYPASGHDPRTRSAAQLWADIRPEPVVPAGTAPETPRDIEFRRVMARGRLLQQYPPARQPTAQAMIDFNLGRDIKGFNLTENDTAPGNPHTIRDHVLNGSGQIKNVQDLALRALRNVPPTGGGPASAFRSVSNADSSIRTGIQNHMANAGGWPDFRETIIRTTGNANATPGPISGGAVAGTILNNAVGGVPAIAVLPAYLSTYTYMGTSLAAAAGTRPLYPGDPHAGLTGAPLTTASVVSGTIRIVMRTQPPQRGGWFVLTAFPEP